MVKKKQGGAISQADRKYVLENMNKLSHEEMANKIGKHPEVVNKIIRTYTDLPQAESQSARWHLKHSLHWKHLKEQFTLDELNKIEDQYVKYVQQFKEDIIATEEVQILNLIKLEILMDRNLKGKMKLGENINRYEKMVESLVGPVDGDFSALDEGMRNTVMDLENRKEACLGAENARTSELMNLQKEHNVLMKSVMGSRDQRITEIMNTKVSFMGLVKQLLDKDRQENDSRTIELYKLATDKEFVRLSDTHKFADGQYDNPILSAEVIERFEQEEEELEQKQENKVKLEEIDEPED